MHKIDQIVIDALKAHRARAEAAGAFSGPDQELPVIVKTLAAQDATEVAIAYWNHIQHHMVETNVLGEPVKASKARKPRGGK